MSMPGPPVHLSCAQRTPATASAWWLDVEFLSVVATLFFMLLGGFGAALGLPAAWAPWCFLAAYLAGGWHGTIHGVRSLLHGAIDVDLLMILAALGAAYVHHAFEGAMLLFSSRSRTRCRKWRLSAAALQLSALNEIAARGRSSANAAKKPPMVPVEKLIVGDIVVLRPGRKRAGGWRRDGEVKARSIRHPSPGESLPVDKKTGRCSFRRHDERAWRAGDERQRSWRANRHWRSWWRWWRRRRARKPSSQRFLEKAEQVVCARRHCLHRQR